MKFILEQSLLEIIQVNVSNFVLFDEILKIRTLKAILERKGKTRQEVMTTVSCWYSI